MIPFTIHNQVTAKEFMMYFLRQSFRKPRIIIFSILSLAAIVINVAYHFDLVDPFTAALAPWPLIIAAPVLILLRVIFARTAYNGIPKLKNPVDYTFTEDELQAKTEDSEWSYKWGSTAKTKDTKHFLFIFRSATDYEMIRKDTLTPAQLDFIKIKTSKFSI